MAKTYPSEAELAALEALCDAATPGPWTAAEYGYYVTAEPSYLVAAGWDDNAAFIAASRTAVPALITDLRASQEREARLREALGRMIVVTDCIGIPDDHEGISLLYAVEITQARDKARAALATPDAGGTGIRTPETCSVHGVFEGQPVEGLYRATCPKEGKR